MKLHKFLTVSSILAVLFFFFYATPVISQEVEDEKEFSYERGSETGPEHWGELHKEWSACGHGRMQSPIDLGHERAEVVHHLGELRRSYQPAEATMKNRGHDITLKWEEGGAGGMWINGTLYLLKQLHWHSPSEHTIHGKRYSLELHMVHESSDSEIAVVGILYTIGRTDSFLKKMEGYIRKMEGMGESEEKVGLVDPRDIKRGSRKYYRYMGSLTTPPCTEGVIWTIMKKVRSVSREQLNLLREAVHDDMENNARPTQPINKRVVELYRPKKIPS